MLRETKFVYLHKVRLAYDSDFHTISSSVKFGKVGNRVIILPF